MNKALLIEIGMIAAVFYIALSSFALLIGLCNKIEFQNYPTINKDYCSIKTNLSEYAFPAYKLGCWLGEEIK